jgi:hypothetical protein
VTYKEARSPLELDAAGKLNSPLYPQNGAESFCDLKWSKLVEKMELFPGGAKMGRSDCRLSQYNKVSNVSIYHLWRLRAIACNLGIKRAFGVDCFAFLPKPQLFDITIKSVCLK